MLDKEIDMYLAKCNMAFQGVLQLEEKVNCYFSFENDKENLMVCFELPQSQQQIPYFKNNILGNLSVIGMKFEKTFLSRTKLVIFVSCESMAIFWEYVKDLVNKQSMVNGNDNH